VAFQHHEAHQITHYEFAKQDLIILMDNSNLRLLGRIVPDWEDAPAGAPLQESGIEGKVHLMMEFAAQYKSAGKRNIPDVADPWYTGDFEQTYQDVLAGCTGLLEQIYR
jgi:protein-tyrosine phosphatase